RPARRRSGGPYRSRYAPPRGCAAPARDCAATPRPAAAHALTFDPPASPARRLPTGLVVVRRRNRAAPRRSPMKLTDTQLVILSAASQRADRAVLPLPGDMDEAAGMKALRLLLKKKLVTEAVADAGADGSAVRRTDKNGTRYVLAI